MLRSIECCNIHLLLHRTPPDTHPIQIKVESYEHFLQSFEGLVREDPRLLEQLSLHPHTNTNTVKHIWGGVPCEYAPPLPRSCSCRCPLGTCIPWSWERRDISPGRDPPYRINKRGLNRVLDAGMSATEWYLELYLTVHHIQSGVHHFDGGQVILTVDSRHVDAHIYSIER